MVPPAPEKAHPWRGGWDREGSQNGFVARRPWGRWAVVQMHNPADAPAERVLATDALEDLGGKVHAWSFCDRRYLGLVDPNMSRYMRHELLRECPIVLQSE